MESQATTSEQLDLRCRKVILVEVRHSIMFASLLVANVKREDPIVKIILQALIIYSFTLEGHFLTLGLVLSIKVYI